MIYKIYSLCMVGIISLVCWQTIYTGTKSQAFHYYHTDRAPRIYICSQNPTGPLLTQSYIRHATFTTEQMCEKDQSLPTQEMQGNMAIMSALILPAWHSL